MKTNQQEWRATSGWTGDVLPAAQLVLCFGDRAVLQSPARLDELTARYPNAHVIACSAGGAIADTRVLDEALAVTAVEFEHSEVAIARAELNDRLDEFAAGRSLCQQLTRPGLAHVLLFAPGLSLNAAQVLAGLRECLPSSVTVTGGLASDGAAFVQTIVATAGRTPTAADVRQVVAVGLYGSHLRIGFGSMGGWDTFGPDRRVTKSRGNVLLELDGQPALTLYKRYLGEHAAGLPASGLLFPLAVRHENGETVTRTLLNIDEAEGSITLAGDIPEGSIARLMRGNLERLIDGATTAAMSAVNADSADGQRLAILVSCIGRRLVLKQRIEEEVEAVRYALGPQTTLTGFYSNGELCPNAPGRPCSVHNQTMTVTTIAEAA